MDRRSSSRDQKSLTGAVLRTCCCWFILKTCSVAPDLVVLALMRLSLEPDLVGAAGSSGLLPNDDLVVDVVVGPFLFLTPCFLITLPASVASVPALFLHPSGLIDDVAALASMPSILWC
jgi:hypothetical protein